MDGLDHHQEATQGRNDRRGAIHHVGQFVEVKYPQHVAITLIEQPLANHNAQVSRPPTIAKTEGHRIG
jgi:hypothetical protein